MAHRKFSQHYGRLLVLFLFAVVTFVLYGSNLNGFWRSDDTAILYHLMTHSLPAVFISPADWQDLSPANLTPLLTFSYAVDHVIAGLTPAVFYLHQQLIIILTAWVAYLLLARQVAAPFAFMGALLFLLGTPTANTASQLMTRHYAEGLLLSLLSCLFFISWQQRKTWQHLAVCLLCYGLAMTAKEIYVPLGVYFLLHLQGTLKERLRQGLPFLALILCYTLWRGYMLNTMVGGYTESSQYMTPAFWKAAATSFLAMPTVLLGRQAPYFGFLAIILLIAGLARLKKHRLDFILIAGLVLTPLLPLMLFPGVTSANRYMYLPWFTLSFLLALFSGHLYQQFSKIFAHHIVSAAAGIFAVVLLSLALTHELAANRTRQNLLTESDTQMRFVWENDNAVSFRPSNRLSGTFWLIRASGKIKSLGNPNDTIPVAITDERFLSADRPLFEYSPACQCMMNISRDVDTRVTSYLEKLRSDIPLSVHIENNQGFLTWSFTAPGRGRFNLVTDARGNIPAPPQGRARTNLNEDTDFYLRFTSAEGWITYSPLLTIYADGRPTNWSRE